MTYKLFGILIMPATVITLLGNYLIHPFVNTLNNLRKDNNYNEFNKLTKKIILILLVLGFIAVIVAGLIGIYVLNFIYQIKLDSYRLELIIIILAAILYTVSMILSGVLTLLNINKKQIYVYVVSTVSATVLCYFLAKGNVINGSAMSYFIASVINLALFVGLYVKEINKLRKAV